ncbi:MAG: oligosaccharide flippase family protein [Oscillochloris sp.]|nr:oligosaccharide flippase family protein [Oscillochloris sp.]
MIKNGIFNVLGALIRGAINVLTIPLLIMALGIDEYGTWSLVFATLSLIIMIEGGLAVTTTVFLSKDLAQEDVTGTEQTLTATFAGSLLLATVGSILIWIATPAIVTLFPNLEADQRIPVTMALSLSGLAIWPRLLQQVPIGIEQAFRRYDLLSLLLTVQTLVTNVGMLILAWRGGMIVQLMQWHILVGFMMMAIHGLVALRLLRRLQLRPHWDTSRSIKILRFTTSNWLMLIGSTLFSQVDRLIVGALLGTRVLGVYAAITNLTAQINVLSALPVQPLLPELGRATASNAAITSIQTPLRQSVQINAVAALGIGGTLLALAPLVTSTLLPGMTAPETEQALHIATIIYALYSLNAVGYFVLLGLGAVLQCMAIVVAAGVGTLLLIALGGTMFGLPGALAGNAGYMLTLLLNVVARRKLSLPADLWMRWLRFPLLWFAGVILLSLVLPTELLVRVTLSCVSGAVLIWWYVLQDREYLLLLLQRISQKRN